MTRWITQRHVDMRRVMMNRDDRFLAYVEHDLKREVAEQLVEQLPLGQPTMVRIYREDFEDYATRSQVIRYELEVTACRSMDVVVPRTVYRDPEPEIRYVDRPYPVVVEKIVEVKPPSFWQRVASHLKSMTAEVEYDGGYGDPE